MIIVTGASRGLGAAVAESLISRGEDVVGIARTVDNIKFESIECDVGSYASVKNAAKVAKKMNKPLKAFINAAGIASMNMAVTTNASTVQKLIQTNLIGTISLLSIICTINASPEDGKFY